MPLDELELLPDLVGLGLPVDVLEIDQLADRRMNVDVVTSADAGKTESESLGQGASIGEAEVVRGLQRTLEELAGVHPRVLPSPPAQPPPTASPTCPGTLSSLARSTVMTRTTTRGAPPP